MSLRKKLTKRERKIAYSTWLDHVESKSAVPADMPVVYNDFRFFNKEGRFVGVCCCLPCKTQKIDKQNAKNQAAEKSKSAA